MRVKLMMAVIALACCGALGATGCSKNACQKAADHMVDCMEAFCAENEDNDACSDERREAGMAALEENAGECTEEMAEQSEALVEMSCDDLTAMFQ